MGSDLSIKARRYVWSASLSVVEKQNTKAIFSDEQTEIRRCLAKCFEAGYRAAQRDAKKKGKVRR